MKPECPISKATPFLGAKWTLELIYYLRERRRFCELQEVAGGLNPATLSQRLKTLEAEQIISRRVIPDAQRHVAKIAELETANGKATDLYNAEVKAHAEDEALAERRTTQRNVAIISALILAAILTVGIIIAIKK